LLPVQAYTAGQAWKSIVDRLKGPYYLSRGGHDDKPRAGTKN